MSDLLIKSFCRLCKRKTNTDQHKQKAYCYLCGHEKGWVEDFEA